MDLVVEEDAVRIGERFAVSFQRTLRVPEEGGPYPLPPSLGRFPVRLAGELADTLPRRWRGLDAVVIPVYQREAVWLAFEAAAWRPNAVKVGVGAICAVSGQQWNETLHGDPQNYLVCPPQPWLDGLNTGSGEVRQFVSAPLGTGSTVESQLTGADTVGGMQILVYDPAPGRFPESAPGDEDDHVELPLPSGSSLGIAPGGRIVQKIYADPYGPRTWDASSATGVFVHLLNSEQYRELTGVDPPPTPVDVEAYIDSGLPWFEIYDEDHADVAAPERLRTLRGLDEPENRP